MKNKYVLELPDQGTEAMFYSDNDQERRCIGHLRCDFGRHGDEFWTTFFPHEARSLAGDDFSKEFDTFVNYLREELMKSRSAMRKYISSHPSLPLESTSWRYRNGYYLMTNRYEYFIRCQPMEGDYDAYIYAYLREADNG